MSDLANGLLEASGAGLRVVLTAAPTGVVALELQRWQRGDSYVVVVGSCPLSSEPTADELAAGVHRLLHPPEGE